MGLKYSSFAIRGKRNHGQTIGVLNDYKYKFPSIWLRFRRL